MNCGMEIHDSYLTKLRCEPGVIILEFDGYIHVSAGEPGVDKGKGYVQPLVMKIHNGRIIASITEIPCDLWDGNLNVDGRQLDNLVPVPFEHRGTVELRLDTKTGETLTLIGESLTLIAAGEARYVYVEEVDFD